MTLLSQLHPSSAPSLPCKFSFLVAARSALVCFLVLCVDSPSPPFPPPSAARCRVTAPAAADRHIMDDLSRSEYPAMLVSLPWSCHGLQLSSSRQPLTIDRAAATTGEPAAQPGRSDPLGSGQAHLQDQPGNRRLATGTLRRPLPRAIGRKLRRELGLNLSAGAAQSRGAIRQWAAEAPRVQGPQHGI